jgi:hypothetical protein
MTVTNLGYEGAITSRYFPLNLCNTQSLFCFVLNPIRSALNTEREFQYNLLSIRTVIVLPKKVTQAVIHRSQCVFLSRSNHLAVVALMLKLRKFQVVPTHGQRRNVPRNSAFKSLWYTRPKAHAGDVKQIKLASMVGNVRP